MLKAVSSITNAIGALNYKGTWDANTNSPTLTSGVGTKGDYYVVSTAGTTTLDGISNWGVGDWVAFNGSAWQRVEGGADLNGVNLSVTGTTTLSGLTASTALALDASKNVVSVTNTGTGSNVLASGPSITSPTFATETTHSYLTASSAVATDANKKLVSVTNTGTGNNVLATNPALAGPSYLASAPATVTGRKNDFSSGQVVMANSTIDLCTIPAAAVGLSGMVFVACESSGGIGFGYIIYFVMSNNSFTATALASGSSQGTHAATLSLSGTTIRLTTTYSGGIGGNVTGTAAGFVVVNNF